MDSPIPVYNLDVEDFNSYFVTGGVLVHNGCQYQKKISPPNGKVKDDLTTPLKQLDPRPYIGEKPKDAAERIMRILHPDGNFKKGPGSEFNQLKKYFESHFRN